jgi:metal-responsive CopG/Arc/MetJ family transcriptional regulator
MANPSVEMPDDMEAEIDDRRHATVSRSQWIREAIQARLNAEDAGTWTAPDAENVDPADA